MAKHSRKVPVLTQVAEGVLVHQSQLLQNNTVVVQGRAGVLLIDPGVTGDEMACVANDLRELGQPVMAGFSTHPDLGSRALAHRTRRSAPLWHSPLRGPDARSAVGRGLAGPRRRGLPPEVAEEILQEEGRNLT
jgi:glyoxylase-like metal-dependent hydrolase (beta-lactamase superfamily II)